MELDYKTVKALASPTRIEILRSALDGDTTTTQISDELGKSKSTVSSHLQKLSEAGLLDKDQVEGRKRVSYVPTGKARAIVEGRERSVKFSIATGFIFAIAGTASAGRYVTENFGLMQSQSGDLAASSSEPQMGAMMADSMERSAPAVQNATESSSQIFEPELVFLAAGILFLSTSALTFAYGYLINRLGKRSS